MMKNEDDLTAINVRTVPRSLRKRFKSWCIDKELPMQDAVIKLIEMALKRDLDLKEN